METGSFKVVRRSNRTNFGGGPEGLKIVEAVVKRCRTVNTVALTQAPANVASDIDQLYASSYRAFRATRWLTISRCSQGLLLLNACLVFEKQIVRQQLNIARRVLQLIPLAKVVGPQFP